MEVAKSGEDSSVVEAMNRTGQRQRRSVDSRTIEVDTAAIVMDVIVDVCHLSVAGLDIPVLVVAASSSCDSHLASVDSDDDTVGRE